MFDWSERDFDSISVLTIVLLVLICLGAIVIFASAAS